MLEQPAERQNRRRRVVKRSVLSIACPLVFLVSYLSSYFVLNYLWGYCEDTGSHSCLWVVVFLFDTEFYACEWYVECDSPNARWPFRGGRWSYYCGSGLVSDSNGLDEAEGAHYREWE